MTRPLFSREETVLAAVVVATVLGGVLQHVSTVPRALLAGPLTVIEVGWNVAAASLAPFVPVVLLAWAMLATYGVWSVVR